MEKRELVSDYHFLCVWEWLSVYVYVDKTGPPLCNTIRKMDLQARESTSGNCWHQQQNWDNTVA